MRSLFYIYAYIAGRDPLAAERLIERLIQTMKTLSRMPEIGRKCDDLGLPTVRRFVVEKHHIFYVIDGQGIKVVAFACSMTVEMCRRSFVSKSNFSYARSRQQWPSSDARHVLGEFRESCGGIATGHRFRLSRRGGDATFSSGSF